MLAMMPFSLLSSHLLSKNIKIKIYKLIILHIVLFRVSENRVLRIMFRPKDRRLEKIAY
jgi:hypothetical protein